MCKSLRNIPWSIFVYLDHNLMTIDIASATECICTRHVRGLSLAMNVCACACVYTYALYMCEVCAVCAYMDIVKFTNAGSNISVLLVPFKRSCWQCWKTIADFLRICWHWKQICRIECCMSCTFPSVFRWGPHPSITHR